jgi:predicted nucleic acid-binding protein
MSARTFVDTNVLVYLFDRDAPEKRRRARALLAELQQRAVVSTQVLQEFFVSVTRKLARPLPEDEAEAAVRDLASLEVIELDVPLVLRAIGRARRQRLSLWDALIVEAALAGSCEVLFTEDLQHNQRLDALRIENPFR